MNHNTALPESTPLNREADGVSPSPLVAMNAPPRPVAKPPRAPSRSEGEDGAIYGFDSKGIPGMLDVIPAGHMPTSDEACDLLLQFIAARHGKRGVFLTRGRSLLGGAVEPH